MKKVRLTEFVIEAIRKNFTECFLPNDKLWLFGSRVDLAKKGGDIDLYIETNIDSSSVAVDKKIKFLSKLYQEIGEQKIDVVLRLISSSTHLAIYDVAISEGVQLI